MQVIEYDRYGGPEVIELRDRSEPQPAAGEVLVRIHAAALNPKDALVRSGKFKRLAGPGFPKRMGYDLAGEVAAVGEGVRGYTPGQPVYGMIQSWRAGAFAEYVALPADELAPRPAGLDYAQAAAIPLAAQTALQALRDLAGVRPGDRVAIHGASGGVGTLAVQIAKALGARVSAICGADSAELVRGLGADEVFDYRQTDPARLPGRYQAYFDVFGNQRYGAVKPLLTARGCYVSTVPSARNIRDHLLTRLSPLKRARLVVVRSKRADLEQLSEWVAQGRLKPLIAARLPLAETARAHAMIQGKNTHGKIVLDIP
ncbi:NAD(P)-dependent alcohol dehydrogenase [Stagnimonas aquatica]|uniref:NAD(P)-dependent alcohol dehydrogenase n=1 Tax=Stagnimonas aquatica TaxID=2689987 RepID=A0A3N0VE93_9GAMM|nr:NAD(P)-dependent alcohol dehydrogenase [Stagnimonas aquatica]ROH90984.1 NAD(P)-dependent alcohol dehydrogenase [Stagnimonas aquatica]